MVDARRCRIRRGAELWRNRKDPENGVTPPLFRSLFVAREFDGVSQAACLPAFALAGLPAAILAEGSRAPGPGWVWTSLASSGSWHSEQTITGSNALPHLRCSC